MAFGIFIEILDRVIAATLSYIVVTLLQSSLHGVYRYSFAQVLILWIMLLTVIACVLCLFTSDENFFNIHEVCLLASPVLH